MLRTCKRYIYLLSVQLYSSAQTETHIMNASDASGARKEADGVLTPKDMNANCKSKDPLIFTREDFPSSLLEGSHLTEEDLEDIRERFVGEQVRRQIFSDEELASIGCFSRKKYVVEGIMWQW